MTFRHGRYWWTRIPTSRGPWVRRSLKTENKTLAEQLERMIASWRDQARWDLLDPLATGELPVSRAFAAYQRAGADDLVRELAEERRLATQAANDGPDLVVLIDRWSTWLKKQGKREDTVTAYARQVRALLGDGPVRVHELTRPWIRERIASLPVKQTNRYRSALSAYCTWLVDEDILARNPVRDVRRIAEAAPRDRHLARAEILKVLDALPAPYRALNALMAGTGMEISAALSLRYGDIDRKRRTVRARGTKRRHRDRTVKFFARWTEEWNRFVEHLDANPGVGDALVFPGIHRRRAYQVLVEACEAVEISDYTQHDWRHTYAVQGVRDRMPDHLIAHQLGHANVLMVQLVYGRYRVSDEDLEAWNALDVTSSVTSTGTDGGARSGQ